MSASTRRADHGARPAGRPRATLPSAGLADGSVLVVRGGHASPEELAALVVALDAVMADAVSRADAARGSTSSATSPAGAARGERGRPPRGGASAWARAGRREHVTGARVASRADLAADRSRGA